MVSMALPFPSNANPPDGPAQIQALAVATPKGELCHYEYGALTGIIASTGETTFDASATSFVVPGPRIVMLHLSALFVQANPGATGAKRAGMIMYLWLGAGIPPKNGNYRVARAQCTLATDGGDSTASKDRRLVLAAAGTYTCVFTLISFGDTARADGATDPLEYTVTDLGVPGP